MHSSVISELKQLQYARSEETPFSDHTAFQVWADKVIPLLVLDKSLQSSFKNAVATVESLNAIDRIDYPVRAINDAIGALNQAVDSLELQELAALHPAPLPPLTATTASQLRNFGLRPNVADNRPVLRSGSLAG